MQSKARTITELQAQLDRTTRGWSESSTQVQELQATLALITSSFAKELGVLDNYVSKGYDYPNPYFNQDLFVFDIQEEDKLSQDNARVAAREARLTPTVKEGK